MGDNREMAPVLYALDRNKFSFIAPEFRGHGRSFHGELPLSYELYADDVFGILDHLGVEDASVIGFSDGAITGIVMGYQQPKRVKTVVAIAPDSGKDGWHKEIDLHEAFANIAQDEEMRNDYQSLSPEPEKFDLLLESLKSLWLSPVHINPDKMSEIEAFCWFVGSEMDEFMKLEDIEMLCNKVPKAEMVVLSDLKHGELTPTLAELSRGNRHVLTDMLERRK
ncbi:MAG: alpha/beta fold hydrolase [Ignavibacteriales bacterium]|nr:alpha/beta fold hydrolase [Ignavibacteriales bacterium]